MGREFGHGNEYEAPLSKARVRNFQPRLVKYNVPVEENVDIDDPRAVWEGFPAAELALNGLQLSEEPQRRKRSFRLDDAIQEPGLCKKADWFRLIDGRVAQNPDTGFRQGLDGALEVRGAVVQI